MNKQNSPEKEIIINIVDYVQEKGLRVCPRNVYKYVGYFCKGCCPKKITTCWKKFLKEAKGGIFTTQEVVIPEANNA